MIKFESLTIENGRTYKNITVPLRNQGIVSITGKNGCLAGDTEVHCNRGRNGRRTTIKKLHESFKRGWTKPELVTYTRSYDGNTVRLHPIYNVVYSGKKLCYHVKLENGQEVKGTPDHKILTKDGWTEIKNLLGKEVALDTPKPEKSGTGPKLRDKQLRGIKYHPFAVMWAGFAKRKPPRKDRHYTGYKIELHRAIYEAFRNDLSLAEYALILRKQPEKAKLLWFMNPETHQIYHKDGDHYNNSVDNLECVEKFEHLRHHGENAHENFKRGVIKYSIVVSVEPCGILDTYDIQCLPPHHNFVANGIIVHNSGKSTLWALMETVFYGSTPSGDKRDELVKNTKDACFKTNFNKDDHDYTVSYSRVKKKWEHSIVKDLAVQDFHSRTDTSQAAATILGLTKPEFEGSVHLTQNSQHVLMDGKPAARKLYLSEFFGLDERYDQIHASAKVELGKVQEQIESLSALSYTLQAHRDELALTPQVDVEPIAAEIEAMRRMLAENNAFLQSLQTKLADCKKYTLLAPQALMYADPKALYEVASAEIATIQSMLINAKKTVEHNTRVKNNAAKRLVLESTLRGADSIIHTACRSGENAEEAQLAIYALRARHVQIDPARRELATLAPAEFKDLSIVENSLQHLSNELFAERKKLHAIKSGQCPECGAEHTASSVSEQAAAVTELETLYKTATDDYSYLKSQNQIATRRTWLLSQIADTPEWTKEYDAERNRLDALVKARSVSKECTQQLALLGNEEETLPEHPEAELRSKLQQLSANQSQYLACWQAKEQIPAKPQWDETAISSDIQRCNVYGNECNTSLLALSQKYAECMAQNNRHASLVAKIDEIEIKLKDMPTLKSWELFWLKMVEAYGPRGLRVQKMAEIVEQILRRLPYYTSMLFDEKDMQFSYEVDASNVFIKVKRLEMDTGKGGKPVEHWFEHDISSFSGGEKRRMSVALVLTLADCVPSAKRSNILILDEIDANLDDIGQYRFANDLLPALKSRYESIFVISHSEELQQAAVYDKIWKVTKKNHWSSIEMTDVGTLVPC